MVLLGILGGQEIILIIIAIVILFGGKKIPELMRGIGKGINEFTKAKDGVYDKDEKNENEDHKKDIKSN